MCWTVSISSELSKKGWSEEKRKASILIWKKWINEYNSQANTWAGCWSWGWKNVEGCDSVTLQQFLFLLLIWSLNFFFLLEKRVKRRVKKRRAGFLWGNQDTLGLQLYPASTPSTTYCQLLSINLEGTIITFFQTLPTWCYIGHQCSSWGRPRGTWPKVKST